MLCATTKVVDDYLQSDLHPPHHAYGVGGARTIQEANIKNAALKNAREQADRLARRKVELEVTVTTRLQDHITADKAGKSVAKAMKDVRTRIAQQVSD